MMTRNHPSLLQEKRELDDSKQELERLLKEERTAIKNRTQVRLFHIACVCVGVWVGGCAVLGNVSMELCM